MTNKVDLYFGSGILLVSALIIFGSKSLPASDQGLGAGGFPLFIGICLAFMGLILAVRSILRIRKQTEADIKKLNKRDLLLAGALAVSFLIYTLLVKPLGYILATFCFFLLFMYMFGERRWLRMILISVVFSVGVYFLFQKVFFVMLPSGLLGI